MTKSSQLEAPRNPFLVGEQLAEYPVEKVLVLSGDFVRINSQEFIEMAEIVVDWLPPEVEALYDAAEFLRWESEATKASEEELTARKFAGNKRMLHLLLRDSVEETDGR